MLDSPTKATLFYRFIFHYFVAARFVRASLIFPAPSIAFAVMPSRDGREYYEFLISLRDRSEHLSPM